MKTKTEPEPCGPDDQSEAPTWCRVVTDIYLADWKDKPCPGPMEEKNKSEWEADFQTQVSRNLNIFPTNKEKKLFIKLLTLFSRNY